MEPPSSQPLCRWCGTAWKEGEALCPRCRRPVPDSDLRTLDGITPEGMVAAPPRPPVEAPHRPPPPKDDPLPPVPGQEEFGSWASLRHIFREDKLFAVLLVLMALEMVLAFANGNNFGGSLVLILLWGIVTFTWWGYWIAMISAGLAVFQGLLFLLPGAGIFALLFIVPNAFVLWVLYQRREMFD